jgi:hypothetical protein
MDVMILFCLTFYYKTCRWFFLENMLQTPQNKQDSIKIKVDSWNLSIRCVKFNLKKPVRAFFGCVPTARNQTKNAYLWLQITQLFSKQRYICYGISKKFSPSRFSSTTEFFLRRWNCPNDNLPNLKNICLKIVKKSRV